MHNSSPPRKRRNDMIPRSPAPSTRAVFLACLLVVAGFLSVTAHADEPAVAPVATGEPEAPTLEGLLARWREKPDSIARGIKLQDAYIRESKQRQMKAIFRDAHKAQPENQALLFLYGRIQGGKRGLTLMRSALAARLGRAPSDSTGLLRATRALMLAEVAAGNGQEAETAAKQITSMRGLPEDWTYLGWIQERLLKSVALARTSYGRAVDIKPDHLRARIALARLHAEAGELEEALQLATATVKQHPTSADAHLRHGLMLAASDKKGDAAKAYGRALACAGEDAGALASIGSAYIDIEQQELAYEALMKALAIDPEHGEALGNAGMLAMDKGELSSAASYLKRAAKVQPRRAHIRYLQGVCEQRRGKAPAAVTHLRKAMSLEPNRVQYVIALALAYMEKKSSLPAAVSMFKRAIKMTPKDPDLHLQLGIAYHKQRKFKLARKAFEAMATLAPKDPRPHYYLAIIYGDKMGKTKEAIASLQSYKALGGKEPTALAWLEKLFAATGQK